jgi:hypothetical protein
MRIAFSLLIAAPIIIVLLNAQTAVCLFPLLLAAILLLIIVEYLHGRAKEMRGTEMYAKLLSKAGGDRELMGGW